MCFMLVISLTCASCLLWGNYIFLISLLGSFCSIIDPKISFSEQETQEGATTEKIFGGKRSVLSPYDMKRLESYTNNLADYHLVSEDLPVKRK